MIFLGVGSSIGNAEAIFASAEAWLEARGVKVIKKSQNLKNPPVGGVATNEFTNAVWHAQFLETSWEKVNWCLLPRSRRLRLKAYKLLKLLKKCEAIHGRTKSPRWSDRPLDLDILTFHELVINKTKLIIPHPEIANRSFVLRPWSELVDARFEIPNLGRIKDLISKL